MEGEEKQIDEAITWAMAKGIHVRRLIKQKVICRKALHYRRSGCCLMLNWEIILS
jgi:hypothetical protein